MFEALRGITRFLSRIRLHSYKGIPCVTGYLSPSVGLSSSANTATTICPANMVTVASCLVRRQSDISRPAHQWKQPVPSNLIFQKLFVIHKDVQNISTWADSDPSSSGISSTTGFLCRSPPSCLSFKSLFPRPLPFLS